MITELTAEQTAQIPEFIEKWTRIGLCAEPADRPAAEEGVRLSYRITGLDPPEKIVWSGSPLAMGLARFLARKSTPSIRTSVEVSVGDSVGDSVRASVGASVRSKVWTSVQRVRILDDSVVDSISGVMAMKVADSVWDSVRTWGGFSGEDSVLASINNSDLRWGSVWVGVIVESVHGQHNANWFAYYDYFRGVCGLTEQTEKMLGLMQVAENAGWWLPYEDICWICERPNRLKLDDRGRLHCEDAPALSYPDGWSIYAIHGVLVNEQVVLRPGTQTIDQITKERNAEVKRIRIERFGWPEYLRKVGATVLDVCDNDVEATKEALMRTPDGEVVLVCACPSTSRVYCLEVPQTVSTCEAAQDWLSGGLSHRVINGA